MLAADPELEVLPALAPALAGHLHQGADAGQVEVVVPGGAEHPERGIGAEAVRDMLTQLDLGEERETLRLELGETTSEAKRKKAAKRSQVLELIEHSEDFQARGEVAPDGSYDEAPYEEGYAEEDYDEEYAAESRFGELVAPQSFAVCTDDSHGAAPAIQGNIPGTHMLFGGDEWWFFGPRIEPLLVPREPVDRQRLTRQERTHLK